MHRLVYILNRGLLHHGALSACEMYVAALFSSLIYHELSQMINAKAKLSGYRFTEVHRQ